MRKISGKTKLTLSEDVQLYSHAESGLTFPCLFILFQRNRKYVGLYNPLSLFPGSQVLSQRSGAVSGALPHQGHISWRTANLTDSWFWFWKHWCILRLGSLDTVPCWPNCNFPIISTLDRHDSGQILLPSYPFNPTHFFLNFNSISILYQPRFYALIILFQSFYLRIGKE